MRYVNYVLRAELCNLHLCIIPEALMIDCIKILLVSFNRRIKGGDFGLLFFQLHQKMLL